MVLRSTSNTWGAITRGLHWLSAALVVFGLTHGYWMANVLPRPQRLAHYWFHSLVFVYFAFLLLIRIAWRLSEPSPRQPVESAPWEKAAARLGHAALYAVTVAVTVTGYLNWSAFPARFDPARAPLMDIWVFGIVKLPAIHVKADRAVFQFWEHSHTYLSWALAALVVVHVLAALRHHYIKRNNVMRRMWLGQPG
jgi:cytochrome b561